MTKEELIGLVKLNLGNKGDLHENQIHLNLALAWQQMLDAVYAKNPGGVDRYAKSYRMREVLKDASTGTYYSELPITPIRFNDTAEGLRRVTKARQLSNTSRGTGDDIIFVPIPIQQTQLIAVTDAGSIVSAIGYYIKDDRVWYFHMDENITSVDMDIVPKFEHLEYDEEINIPPMGVQMLIGITQEILKGTPYVDPRLRKINLQEI